MNIDLAVFPNNLPRQPFPSGWRVQPGSVVPWLPDEDSLSPFLCLVSQLLASPWSPHFFPLPPLSSKETWRVSDRSLPCPSSSTGLFNFNTRHRRQERAGTNRDGSTTLMLFAFPLCKRDNGWEGFALCFSVAFLYSKEKANFDSGP